jgi:pimeloyl-ACP methyl ester carboxylesterase
MATFVLIPGGWQGGWVFDDVANRLVAQGHGVRALTLSGLDGTAAPSANLSLHIDEAIKAIEECSDAPIVVGQSYAGLVMTGAADAEPGNVRGLVYVDACVPRSGDSCWSLTGPHFRDLFIAGARADGINCVPPPDMDPRCRPQPIATFLQAIALTGRWLDVPRKTYIGAHGWEGSPFLELYDRLSADPAWTTYAVDCGHNVARHQPEVLARLLLALV